MQLSASNYLKSLLDFQHSLIIRRRHIMWTEEVDLKPSINHVTIQMNHRTELRFHPTLPTPMQSVSVERQYKLALPLGYFTTSVPQPEKH